MILRKINAVISLICTFLLMIHAFCHATWMLSSGRIALGSKSVSWLLVVFMAAHAIISISFGISAHRGVKKQKYKSYPRLNASAMIQRVGGILMIFFTALHIADATGYLQPPEIVQVILPPLFFALTLLHVAVSGSKALITLGIGNAKVFKIADIIIKLICCVMLVADVAGFYLYVF